jgi:magnesium chelatase family protein
MNLAILHSRASFGIKAPPVTIEAHISGGLPKFFIVGLPEAAVKESRDRVRSALINSQFEFPARRITVDLPIALGILAATGQIPADKLDEYEFAGELALSGALRSFPGALPFALATQQADRKLILPLHNAEEATLPGNITVLAAAHLLDVCAHLTGRQSLSAYQAAPKIISSEAQTDLSDVRGQAHAKRALEIAAAGNHSLLMMGPPGTGKTMLASRLPSILPTLNDEEALEVAAITSISKQIFTYKQWRKRPFRSPHHTASSVALVGGGSPPRPGEISLAHHGVLFLDELPEFNRRVLESLREPLESGTITISRAARQAEFPARFQLIAAMNPCPCGHLGNSKGDCHCTPEQVQRYRARLSGPLLDRIDLHIEVPPLPQGVLTTAPQKIENSADVRVRVEQARCIQYTRANKTNHALVGKELEKYCVLADNDKKLLDHAIQKLNLSARSFHRVLRIARTIADLANQENIITAHLTEALSYRRLERGMENV